MYQFFYFFIDVNYKLNIQMLNETLNIKNRRNVFLFLVKTEAIFQIG